MEKAGDNKGAGARGQADIEKFYDQIPILRTLRDMVACGLDIATAAAIARLQLLPVVVLRCGGKAWEIRGRSRGGVTGSRCAVQLGRWVVNRSAARCSSAWRGRAFERDDGAMLAFATWVDNIFSFAPSADAAVSILCDFEADLSPHWGLRWKPASRMVMSARGCPTGLSSRLADLGWAEVSSFCVLGAVVMDNGAPWEDLSDCESKMWQN